MLTLRQAFLVARRKHRASSHFIIYRALHAMEKKLSISNQLEQLTQIAVFVEELCEELELGADLVFNLNLVLEEAVTNVIMYAFPEGGEHLIGLEATTADGVLSLTVQDDGVAFDPTAVPEADVSLSAEERPIGGLGIFLIRQIMDKVVYQRTEGKNVLTMKKKLKEGGVA